jgi:signal transduction histidine kinase
MVPSVPAVLLSLAAVSAGLALVLQRRRARRAAAVADARFQTIMTERARLARELHDTLLQRFTGITLQIDGVRNSLQQQSNPLAEDLSRILQQTDQILRESREMVWVTDTNLGQAVGGGSQPGDRR